MENIHFSIQDLIEIMTFTTGLIYLLRLFLINLIPPKSNKYFALHLGWLVVVALGFLIKFFIGQTLFSCFLILASLSIVVITIISHYYVKRIVVKHNIGESRSYTVIVRSLMVSDVGAVLFLTAWLCALLNPPSQSFELSIVDSLLTISLLVLLPIQSMYYSHNSPKNVEICGDRGEAENNEIQHPGWNHILIFGYLGLIIAALVSIGAEKITFVGFPYVIILSYLLIIAGLFCFQKKERFNGIQVKAQEPYIEDLASEKRETYIELKNKLIDLMEKDQLYLNKTLTIQDVATVLNTNTKYLSEAINTQLNKGFVLFINEYRVKHAKDLLKNPKNNHYTLETIGELSGFNSKSSFNAVFKKVERRTPSSYKMLQQQGRSNSRPYFPPKT